MLTKCWIRLWGAYSTSVLAVDVVDLFFVETTFVMVLQDALAGSRPDWSWGPVEALWPMMGQPGRRPWVRQKQVEERERVVENQRFILGILGRLMFSLRDDALAWSV
jgi:hypothetical protein